jgi:hypothetical protein
VNKRPVSVTIVAWYVIIGAFFSLYALSRSNTDLAMQQVMEQSLLSIATQQYVCFAGFVSSLMAGAAILMGYHWGRVLFVGWSAISLVVGLATSPMKLMVIPGLLVLGVLAYFLFSSKANGFFRRGKETATADA